MQGRATKRKRDLVATIWEELTAACKTMDGTKRYAFMCRKSESGNVRVR